MNPLRIATRRSALALWQAGHVVAGLRAAHPSLAVELLPMTTRGDQVQDRALASIGGKGLFLKELEQAMLEGRADLAVHSLKDVPANLEPGFVLGAILERADAADALVGARGLDLAALPAGARVGSSSLRRQAQLRALRPDLVLLDLRGNVNTRLARLDAGDYDAIVLACAGLDRLGLSARIGARLAPPEWLPGVGQGAIAIELRSGDEGIAGLLAPLHHADTAACVEAERALNRELAGDCTVPIGAWARLDGDQLDLWGLVGEPVLGACVRGHARGRRDDPQAVAQTVAAQLRALGADALLARHLPAG